MDKTILYVVIFLSSAYSSFSQAKETELIFEAEPGPERVVVVEGDTLNYTPEISPAYPGGDVEIDKHFRKFFPDYSKTKTRKYNKVIWVSFVIRSSGAIGATNIINSEKPEMNEKLTAVLKAMLWTPAVSKGKNVATIGDFYFYFH